MSENHLGDYRVTGLIAPGSMSTVFSAKKILNHQNFDWNVALKVVWDFNAAEDEVRRLLSLDDNKGFVNLIDFFDLPFSEVEPLLDLYLFPNLPEHSLTASKARAMITAGPQDKVGVLVLQYLVGEPLIRKTEVCLEEGEPTPNTLLIKDVMSAYWYRQYLTQPLSFEEKLHIIEEVTRHTAECHKAGVVHADLKPQNILYNRETGQVTILDLCGHLGIGSSGWQGPEHFTRLNGEIDHYPPALDVFLIGLFIQRFLESEKNGGGFEEIANDCFASVEKRPTAAKLLARLERTRRKITRPKKSQYPYLAVAATLLFSFLAFAATWWIAPTKEIELNHGVQRFAYITCSEDAKSPALASMVSNGLESTTVKIMPPGLVIQNLMDQPHTCESAGPSTNEVRMIAEHLGVDLLLWGKTTIVHDGYLWRGALCYQDGTQRRFRVRGETLLQLANRLTEACMELLKLQEEPLPSEYFFSSVPEANMMYAEAERLFQNGDINASLALFERIINFYDPEFHLAGIRAAHCLLFKGEVKAGIELLVKLLQSNTVQEVPSLRLSAYRILAKLYYKHFDLVALRELLPEAQKLAISLRRDLDVLLFQQLALKLATVSGDKEPITTLMNSELDEVNTKDPQVVVQSLLLKSETSYFQQELELADSYLVTALTWAVDHKLHTEIVDIVTSRARIHRASQDPKQQLAILNELEEYMDSGKQTGSRTDWVKMRYWQGWLMILSNREEEGYEIIEGVAKEAADLGVFEFEFRADIVLVDRLLSQEKFYLAMSSLNKYEEVLDTLPPDFARHVLDRKASVLFGQEQYKASVEPLDHVIELAEKLLSPAVRLRTLGRTFNKKGAALHYSNDLDGAEVCYLESLKYLTAIKDTDQPRVLNNLIKLYKTLGRETEAQKYREFLEQYITETK